MCANVTSVEPSEDRRAQRDRWSQDVRLLGVGLLAALVVGTAISAQTYLSMLRHGHAFTGILAWQLSSWGVWALAMPLVVREALPLAAAGVTRRTALRLTVVGVCCIAVHLALTAQLALWFQPYVPERVTGYGDAVARQVSILPVDVLVFALLVFVGWTLGVSQAARRLELRESRLEAELAKAKMEALRLEIQPHFLFNTLNGIAALIRLRSHERALEMLVGLSELMRGTLERSEQVCALDSEIDFTRRYIDLQVARFGERLLVDYQVEAAARGIAVPTFVLQPLVENAIRHGLARRTVAGHLQVGARVDQGTLELWVRDDGVGPKPGFDLVRDAGTGLANTRSRLERLYGPLATLTLTREGDDTVTRVRLPASSHTAAEAIA